MILCSICVCLTWAFSSTCSTQEQSTNLFPKQNTCLKYCLLEINKGYVCVLTAPALPIKM